MTETEGRIKISEKLMLSVSRPRKISLGLKGQVRIEKYKKGESDPYEVVEGPNTILSGGIDFFIAMMTNDSVGVNSNHFDSNSWIGLKTTSGGAVSPVFQVEGTYPQNAAATNSPGHRYTWKAEDNSVDQYNVRYVSLFNAQPGSGPPNPVELNEYDLGSSQSKPDDENWHYNVDIELYSTDSDFTSAGLEHLMDLFVGASAAHLTTGTVLLQPKTSGGANTGTALAPDSITEDYTNDDITIVFTSADGSNEGAWDDTEIQINSGAINLRDGGCKTDGTSCGTKGTGEEWTYTYVFSFTDDGV